MAAKLLSKEQDLSGPLIASVVQLALGGAFIGAGFLATYIIKTDSALFLLSGLVIGIGLLLFGTMLLIATAITKISRRHIQGGEAD